MAGRGAEADASNVDQDPGHAAGASWFAWSRKLAIIQVVDRLVLQVEGEVCAQAVKDC